MASRLKKCLPLLLLAAAAAVPTASALPVSEAGNGTTCYFVHDPANPGITVWWDPGECMGGPPPHTNRHYCAKVYVLRPTSSDVDPVPCFIWGLQDPPATLMMA